MKALMSAMCSSICTFEAPVTCAPREGARQRRWNRPVVGFGFGFGSQQRAPSQAHKRGRECQAAAHGAGRKPACGDPLVPRSDGA